MKPTYDVRSIPSQFSSLKLTTSPSEDDASVAEAQRNPFARARDFKVATNFLGQKHTVILRLKEACLRARLSALKGVLTD
jgi:hypothetical protein